MWNRTPDELADRIADDYRNRRDLSVAQLAELHDVNPSTVLRIARARGIRREPGLTRTDIDRDAILRDFLAEPRENMAVIAARHDVSVSTVRRIAARAGHARRPTRDHTAVLQAYQERTEDYVGDIAAEYGYGRNQVAQIARRHGIPRRRRGGPGPRP